MSVEAVPNPGDVEQPKEAQPKEDPHSVAAIAAERAVLGGILLDNRGLSRATGILQSKDFYRESHRLIFEAMLRLAGGGRAIDTVTLKDALAGKLRDAGGHRYISRLIDGIPRLANIEHHAKIARRKAALRKRRSAAETFLGNIVSGAEEEALASSALDLRDKLVDDIDLPRPVNLHRAGAKRESPEFVVDGFSRRKGLRVVWAPPAGGKTHLMLRFVHELLMDPYPARLFGHPEMVIRRGYKRVLWIATEESEGLLGKKADMVCRGLGDPALAGELLHLFAADARQRITLNNLPALLENEGPFDQVVLDSLTGLRPKLVNGERIRWDLDNDAANDQCLLLRGLAEKHELEITIVHHTGREEGKGYRGPIEWKSSADIMIGLVPQDGDDIVKVQIDKNRDGPKLKPFLLRKSWGPEGFYLEYSGEATSTKDQGGARRSKQMMGPSETRADEYLRRVVEASQAEIMDGAGIKSRTTANDVVRRRLEAGAWRDTGIQRSGSPVYRHVGDEK